MSFTQVPAYQVNTGRDQATAATAGRTSKLLPREAQKSAGAAAAAAANEVDKNLKPGNKAAAGAPATTGSGGQTKQTAKDTSIVPTTGRQRVP